MPCKICDGTGVVLVAWNDGLTLRWEACFCRRVHAHTDYITACEWCAGTGYIFGDVCQHCQREDDEKV